jgi:cysteine desulfurase
LGLPGLLSVRFPGRRAEDLLLLLDRYGVACSAGSACASGAVTPSHVLVAMGRDPAEARETVRFSLGHDSTDADVDAAVAAVARALAVLAPAEGRAGSTARQGVGR